MGPGVEELGWLLGQSGGFADFGGWVESVQRCMDLGICCSAVWFFRVQVLVYECLGLRFGSRVRGSKTKRCRNFVVQFSRADGAIIASLCKFTSHGLRMKFVLLVCLVGFIPATCAVVAQR